MNHSHGYEMRLQTARELRIQTAEKNRVARAKAEVVAAKFDALQRALNAIEALPELLKAYELTGDHDHGGRRGSLGVGEYCPGGDCNVSRARKVIAALNLTTTPKES